MHILIDLENEISKQTVEESQRLYDQIQAGSADSSKQIEKLDEQIWILSEQNRKDVVFGRTTLDALETAKALQKAKSKKFYLKGQTRPRTSKSENQIRDFDPTSDSKSY